MKFLLIIAVLSFGNFNNKKNNAIIKIILLHTYTTKLAIASKNYKFKTRFYDSEHKISLLMCNHFPIASVFKCARDEIHHQQSNKWLFSYNNMYNSHSL